MRLLLTADLRYRLPWFKWLEAQSVHYDAVAIAGDLLDVFYREPLKRQVQRTTNWLRSLGAKTRVIICSGNHDTIDIPVAKPPCPLPAWLTELDSIVTVDGRTTVIQDQVVVTPLSFLATETQKRPLLSAGNQLREEMRLPWIVLHHHPPSLHEGVGQEESIAGRLVREFSPTFWVAGRLYGQEPFLKNRAWIQRIDDTTVLNIPQLCIGGRSVTMTTPFPNNVVLDLEARQLTWHSALQEKADQEVFNLG